MPFTWETRFGDAFRLYLSRKWIELVVVIERLQLLSAIRQPH